MDAITDNSEFYHGNHVDTRWTEQRINRLTELWPHYTASQIAKDIGEGFTRNAIIGKARRIGLQVKRQNTPSLDSAARAARRAASKVQSRERRRKESPRRVRGVREQATPVPPPTIDDQQIPLSQRKDLMTLTNITCRWPVGNPGGPDFFFCGGATHVDLPYCRSHMAAAYRKLPSISEDERIARWEHNKSKFRPANTARIAP